MHCTDIIIFYNTQLLPQRQQILRYVVEDYREWNEVVEQQKGLSSIK